MDARDGAVDHLGLAILSPEECWSLIEATPIGRVAFVDAGAPIVLPVTHGVRGRRIVFLSPEGGKLAAARMAPAVAFEVDDWDAEERTGWSVVAQGVAETVPADVADLDALGVEPWLDGAARGTWIEIRVDEVTGRRLG